MHRPSLRPPPALNRTFEDTCRSLQSKTTIHSIYPLPKPSHGHTISEFGNKNKRVWRPNVIKVMWPVTMLGTEAALAEPKMRRLRMKMTAGTVGRIERLGGLESTLVSLRSLPVMPCHELGPAGRPFFSYPFHPVRDRSVLARSA